MQPPDPYDNTAMRVWVFRTLGAEDDRLTADQLASSTSKQNVQDARDVLRSKKFALEQAAKGDVEPLRRKHPDLARFIHPAKRQRGERGFQSNDGLRLRPLKQCDEIRKLWRETYGSERRKPGQVTAVELAAEYCGVDQGRLQRLDKKG